MKSIQRQFTLVLSAALAWAVSTPVAHATVSGISASNADAYFGSQSDANQASNGVIVPPWTPVGPGPVPTGTTFLPGIPAIPSPSATPAGLNPFAFTPSNANFSDVPGNIAQSSIVGLIGGPNSVIDDAQIAMSMYLNQVGTQYAYEQINYAIDYSLTNTLNSAGTLNGANGGFVSRSFNVSGNVGSFVDFGGEMDFYQIIGGVPTSLGQLTFAYSNASPGAFSTVVTGSGIIGSGVTVNNPDFLRITGDFFVKGDPSSISVQSVPEPSALALLGLGAIGLLKRNRRRPQAA